MYEILSFAVVVHTNPLLLNSVADKFIADLICAAVSLGAVKCVKVKVKVQFSLYQVTKAQRWSRGIALPFL